LASGRSGGAQSAGTADSRGSSDGVAGAPMRSRKVRTILRLEARARRLLTRYERASATATRAMGQARALFDEADGLEYALTGTELGELRRGRADTVRVETAPPSTPVDRSSTTPST